MRKLAKRSICSVSHSRINKSLLPILNNLEKKNSLISWSKSKITGRFFKPQENNSSLSHILWQTSAKVAQHTLETNFIRGIATSTLSPMHYARYMIQDAIFCHNVTQNLQTLLAKHQHPDYQLFLESRIAAFEKYTFTMFTEWRILQPNGINLSKEAINYINFQKKICHELNFFIALIAMLPCEMLWPWLAHQIDNGDKNNLYYFWIESNKSKGKSLQSFIDNNSTHVDVILAKKIFHTSLMNELSFFRSAFEEEAQNTDVMIDLPEMKRPTLS